MKSSIVFMFLVAIFVAFESSDAPHGSESTQDALQRELAEMAERSIGDNWPPPRLRELPRQAVIDALIDALNTGLYKEPKVQFFAYRALAELKAADTGNGYRFFMECLQHSTAYLSTCEGALISNAPRESLPEVADALIALIISDEHTDSDKVITLKLFPHLGTISKLHLETIDRIVRDVQAKERVRWFAAEALIQIGGIAHFLESLTNIDPTGLKVGFWALTKYAGDTKGEFGTDDKELRKKIRAFIRQKLSHPDKEIRELAFQAFIQSYGEEMFFGNKEQGFTANSEFVAALESVAQDDPDEQVRSSTRQLIDRYEKTLAKKNRQRVNQE